MKKVYSFDVELTAILQAQPVKRKSSVIIGTDNPENMSVEEINRPENLHRAIPRFLTGKIRDAYKCTKVLGSPVLWAWICAMISRKGREYEAPI